MGINEGNQKILDKVAGTDEPVFVLRAKDRFSATLLGYYQELVRDHVTNGFNDAIAGIKVEFDTWQQNNSDKVHTPDLDEEADT